MGEHGEGGKRPDGQEPFDERPLSARSHSSGVIFALVALALILAIGFFYLTKDRETDHERTVTESVASGDSAARVVGNAAENAADQLRR